MQIKAQNIFIFDNFYFLGVIALIEQFHKLIYCRLGHSSLVPRGAKTLLHLTATGAFFCTCYYPPTSTFSPAMASPQLLQRLLNQLHALSEVNESLTVRLLELEERVIQLDQKFTPVQSDIPDGDRALLADSDFRIERINEMLEPTQLRSIPGKLNYEEEPEQLFMDEAA
jgi:hypothetical protein